MRNLLQVVAILLLFGVASALVLTWPDRHYSRVERVDAGVLGSIEVPAGWASSSSSIANCSRTLFQASSLSITSEALEVCSQYCDVPVLRDTETINIASINCTIGKEYSIVSGTSLTSFVVRAPYEEQVIFFIVRLKGTLPKLPDFWRERLGTFKPATGS